MTDQSDDQRLLDDLAEVFRVDVQRAERDLLAQASAARGYRERSILRLIAQGVLAGGSVAVVAVLVAVVGLRLSTQGGPASTTATADAQPSATAGGNALGLPVVRLGDRVVATGGLAMHDDELYLCPTQFVGITGGFGCLGAKPVPVRGGDNRAWDGLYARVEGTWDGEAIQAPSVTAVTRPSSASRLPPILCEQPAGGWPGIDGTPETIESASRALEQEVERHPDRYAGWWPAGTTDASGNVNIRAIVVGTVEDVPSVTAALTAVYPFNLCVIHVEFSARELQAVLDQLAAVDRQWHLELEPSVDRVVVWTTALDPEAAGALAAFLDKVDVRATLQPLETPG